MGNSKNIVIHGILNLSSDIFSYLYYTIIDEITEIELKDFNVAKDTGK